VPRQSLLHNAYTLGQLADGLHVAEDEDDSLAASGARGTRIRALLQALSCAFAERKTWRKLPHSFAFCRKDDMRNRRRKITEVMPRASAPVWLRCKMSARTSVRNVMNDPAFLCCCLKSCWHDVGKAATHQSARKRAPVQKRSEATSSEKATRSRQKCRRSTPSSNAKPPRRQ